MKHLLARIYLPLISFLLSLRYRIRVKGLESINAETLPRSKGILFLANHPAEIDPCILLRALWHRFSPHPIAIEYLFHLPVVGYLLNFVGGLPIPSFDISSNSYKRKQMEKSYSRLYDLLNQKENVLIYPAGGLKTHAEESIGGASGVHTILQQVPDINIVLVRTTGLWGSSFSKALTGKTPDLFKAFLKGFKILLKNLIFFTPRRDVLIECTPAPADFPWKGTRREINHYLENWYNAKGPEPLKLVSYSRWSAEYPEVHKAPLPEEVSLDEIPQEIKEKVFEAIAELADTTSAAIQPDQHLSTDLGLDSLDTAQLVVFLKDEFGVNGINSTDLITVRSVCAFAAKIKKIRKEDEEEEPAFVWLEKDRPRPFYPEGKTIPEVFLNTYDRFKGYLACADALSGEVSYRKLKFAILLLAEEIRKLPGDHIGILMPATVGVNILILATIFARKVPVMINWTLGDRNLASVLEQSKIQVTLSSWIFVDRLDNIEMDGIDEQLLFLEELRRKISLFSYLKTFIRSRKKNTSLLKMLKLDTLHEEDPAVILFTSGTENVPKGVPLSHKNLIENQRGAYQMVEFQDEDILLGVLPPFHSFGFSVTGILPLLTGIRAAYSPNPTDGRRMAQAIQKWGITLFCIAPTFLKNLLRVAKDEQLKSLRLVVTGAEKTPQEVFERVSELNPSASVKEGYGITECAPILTLNPPARPSFGVGLPIPGVELLVVHPETHLPLSQGEKGLILARGPNIFRGYLDSKIASPFLDVQGKQWYQTGDLGYLNEEGYLTLSGRLKRFIKIGGEMVSLAAVEEALTQAAKQKGWKVDPERPYLAVCAREDEGKKSEMHLFITIPLTVEEANQILKESGMSNLIRLRSVKQIPFIPLLGTGKIDYRSLSTRV